MSSRKQPGENNKTEGLVGCPWGRIISGGTSFLTSRSRPARHFLSLFGNMLCLVCGVNERSNYGCNGAWIYPFLFTFFLFGCYLISFMLSCFFTGTVSKREREYQASRHRDARRLFCLAPPSSNAGSKAKASPRKGSRSKKDAPPCITARESIDTIEKPEGE